MLCMMTVCRQMTLMKTNANIIIINVIIISINITVCIIISIIDHIFIDVNRSGRLGAVLRIL